MKIKNGITMYLHCKKCFEKGEKDKVAVGWTIKGIQIWCDNCDNNILAMDFQGKKMLQDIYPEQGRNEN